MQAPRGSPPRSPRGRADRRAPPRPRTPRRATDQRTRPPVCRTPSPRRRASRSPRRVRGTRGPTRHGTAWRSPCRGRSRAGGYVNRRGPAGRPSPRRRPAPAPARRRGIATPRRAVRGSCAARSCRGRGSWGPRGPPPARPARDRARGPAAHGRCGPARSRATRRGRLPSQRSWQRRRRTSCAAFRAFRVCIEIVLAVHHSGCRSGIRSWKTVARTPARWAGYIHSLKRNASSAPASRSTAGWPARLQAVRHACEAGNGSSLVEIRTPSSDARIRPGPLMLVGANATSSCRSAPASAIPTRVPRM